MPAALETVTIRAPGDPERSGSDGALGVERNDARLNAGDVPLRFLEETGRAGDVDLV